MPAAGRSPPPFGSSSRPAGPAPPRSASAAQWSMVVPVSWSPCTTTARSTSGSTPATSALLARAAGSPRGGRPGIDPAGAGSTATSSTRSPRPSSRPHTTDLDAAEHIVAGTARSMGIEVVEDK
jgi:large subunit ribosomal protein L11